MSSGAGRAAQTSIRSRKIEKIDWDVMGMVAEKGMPSLATGHFFRADDVGRDLYSRVIQGIGMSLMAGLVSASVAVLIPCKPRTSIS